MKAGFPHQVDAVREVAMLAITGLLSKGRELPA